MKKFKIINIVIVLFFVVGILNVNAQNSMKANMLKYDSTYIALQSVVKNIYKKYGANDSNFDAIVPDSIDKLLEKTFLLLEKRDKEIDKICQNQNDILAEEEANEWYIKTDSIIKLKQLAFNANPKIGFSFSGNLYLFSAQYAFVLNQYRKFDFGIGSGIEYINKGGSNIEVIQMPVFLNNNFYLEKFIFLNFDYGFTIPISGSYKNSKNDKIDYDIYNLKSNFYFELGLGVLTKSNFGIQLNIRNQALGVPETVNSRSQMFGIKFIF
jgi:hypothetical protein